MLLENAHGRFVILIHEIHTHTHIPVKCRLLEHGVELGPDCAERPRAVGRRGLPNERHEKTQ